MRIMFIGGDHPRHLFFLNAIHKSFPVAAALYQLREHMVPEPPDHPEDHDQELFTRHFTNRDIAEEKFFNSPDHPDIPSLYVQEEDLNKQASADFVRQFDPDIVFLFGCEMIRDPLMSVLPHYCINLHLGLSPWYRGTATLFWPFYFLEPNYAGATFHLITSEPDAGDIIHQCLPKLELGDRIHEVACKVIVQSAKDVIKLLEKLRDTGKLDAYKQRSSGKNFLTSDFKPEHLRMIYDVYDDDLVDRYLDGRLKCRTPKIITQV